MWCSGFWAGLFFLQFFRVRWFLDVHSDLITGDDNSGKSVCEWLKVNLYRWLYVDASAFCAEKVTKVFVTRTMTPIGLFHWPRVGWWSTALAAILEHSSPECTDSTCFFSGFHRSDWNSDVTLCVCQQAHTGQNDLIIPDHKIAARKVYSALDFMDSANTRDKTNLVLDNRPVILSWNARKHWISWFTDWLRIFVVTRRELIFKQWPNWWEEQLVIILWSASRVGIWWLMLDFCLCSVSDIALMEICVLCSS